MTLPTNESEQDTTPLTVIPPMWMERVWTEVFTSRAAVGELLRPGVLRAYYRPCLFCNASAFVRLPADSTDLDVEAAFSEQGREFSDYPDSEPVGVACYRCARSATRRNAA